MSLSCNSFFDGDYNVTSYDVVFIGSYWGVSRFLVLPWRWWQKVSPKPQ